MAKKRHAQKGKVEQFEAAPSKGRNVLVIVFITLLLTTAVLLIMAKMNNVNVFQTFDEVSNKVLPAKKEATLDEASDHQLEERVVSLQAEIHEKESEMLAVENELNRQVQETEKLEEERERLLEEIESLKTVSEEKTMKQREVVKAFGKMSAKSAAPVLVEMDDQEALTVLKGLKVDQVAAILEKMTPKEAAKFTSLMSYEE